MSDKPKGVGNWWYYCEIDCYLIPNYQGWLPSFTQDKAHCQGLVVGNEAKPYG